MSASIEQHATVRGAGNAPSTRFVSLDGLRGVAALIVVFFHVSLLLPEMVLADASALATAEPGSIYWWANYTPLKFMTAGPQMVSVFFVLSGFVLCLVPLRKPGFDWIGYIPKRIVRLYVPTIASLLLSAGILVVLQSISGRRGTHG